MNDLFSASLGAVGQVGDAVDRFTGGRALRGTLAGKPRELASVLPFSDSLGITDERDKTSGRDLLDQYGLTKKGDTSFGSNAAGFLADNVLSPANMLGAYGAAKAAPTLAKGAVAAGKALSGLDLIDHVGAGAKAVGNALFKEVEGPGGELIRTLRGVDDDAARAAAGHFGAEAGALGFDKNPINQSQRTLMKHHNNASKGVRYSEDPAKAQFYAADRNARFRAHMGHGERPSYGGPPAESNLPDSHGAMLGKFLGDETGSLAAFAGRRAGSGVARGGDQARRVAADAVDGLAERLGSGSQKLGPSAGRDLAAEFIETPRFDPTPAGLDQARQFSDKLGRGTDAALSYQSSGYRDLNGYLRDLGPEAAAEEIAAIRAGKYGPDWGAAPLGDHAAHPDDGFLADFFGDPAAPQSTGHTPAQGGEPPSVGEDPSLPRVRRNIDGLMGLFDHSRLPRDMDLYRGVNHAGRGAIERQLGVPLNSPEAVGREFTDPAFLSTSHDPRVSKAFTDAHGEGALFEFPKVQSGKTASLMNGREDEVLFPPGRKIRITDNSNFPRVQAELYTLLAALMGGRAAHHSLQEQQ